MVRCDLHSGLRDHSPALHRERQTDLPLQTDHYSVLLFPRPNPSHPSLPPATSYLLGVLHSLKASTQK